MVKKKGKTRKNLLMVQKVPQNAREAQALEAARKVLEGQSQQLGLPDPLETQPAVLFFAEEGKR